MSAIRLSQSHFNFAFLLPAFACVAAAGVAPPATPNISRPPSSALAQPRVSAEYGNLPLSFEKNQGQADPSVNFLSRGSGYSLFLTDEGAVLALDKPADCSPSQKQVAKAPQSAKSTPCPTGAARQDVIRMTLAGIPRESHTVTSAGENALPGKVNYFIGNDPSRWHSDLPTYLKVRYSSVYPGVDLVYYGSHRQLEYDFIVAPGADAKPIQLQFSGAKQLRIAKDGDLVLQGAYGEAALHKPVVYQGNRRPPPGHPRKLPQRSPKTPLDSHSAPMTVLNP